MTSNEMFKQTIQIRWADIDPNRHLRHSVYYDYGASVRIYALTSQGLSIKKMEELMIGPILFREEAIFKREILFGDEITVDVELVKAREDFSRWTLRHNFLKGNDTLAAIINIDGAWIDLTKRKLAAPGPLIRTVFEHLPKADGFEFEPQRNS
jgi:acyl-CoA thioester hydrolase